MKRYRLEGEIWEAEMVEDQDGEYIKYDDAIALLKRLSNNNLLDKSAMNIAIDWMIEE